MSMNIAQRVALQRSWEERSDPSLVAAWIAAVPDENVRATKILARGRFQQGWSAHAERVGIVSDIDGATEEGPAGAYPASAGEFAARWNSWTEAERAIWLDNRVKDSQTASRCFTQNHDHQAERALSWLRSRLFIADELPRGAERIITESQVNDFETVFVPTRGSSSLAGGGT